MNDLLRLNPRVICGAGFLSMTQAFPDLPAEACASMERSHGRFALIVENARVDLNEAECALRSLDVLVVYLPTIEKGIERHLLINVPIDVQPGRSSFTDLLKSVISAWRSDPMGGFLPGSRRPPGRTLVMGILNTTPDSFSDGGIYFDESSAVRHAAKMLEDGADIIDVGGCSTRPGSEEPSLEEEIRRTVPIVARLKAAGDVLVSIDTYRAEVARRALDAGADIVNDVTALGDSEMASLVAGRGVPVILMHMQGTPRTMQEHPCYDDLPAEITRFLRRAVDRAVAAGINEQRIAIDPGFGFGKTVEHNLLMLRRLREFRSLGHPILIGTSRKSTIGRILDRPVDLRQMGTAATVALSVAGGASIVRVHDVAEMRDVIRMAEAVLRPPE